MHTVRVNPLWWLSPATLLPSQLMSSYVTDYELGMCTLIEIHVQCESKKVAPLKLFAIFSLRLSIFP